MTETPAEVFVLGERYVEVTDPDGLLWRGDLFVFGEETGPDCRAYMLYIRDGRLRLVNFVGYKAGSDLVVANIPKEASSEGALNVRISWLRDNWPEIGLGSFATTRFFSWHGQDS